MLRRHSLLVKMIRILTVTCSFLICSPRDVLVFYSLAFFRSYYCPGCFAFSTFCWFSFSIFWYVMSWCFFYCYSQIVTWLFLLLFVAGAFFVTFSLLRFRLFGASVKFLVPTYAASLSSFFHSLVDDAVLVKQTFRCGGLFSFT